MLEPTLSLVIFLTSLGAYSLGDFFIKKIITLRDFKENLFHSTLITLTILVMRQVMM